MKVQRDLPEPEYRDLLGLVADIADSRIAPDAAQFEHDRVFPEAAFQALSDAGLLGLPYPEEFGGANLPYRIYLQVLEELARRSLTVALGVSVHGLSCFPVFAYGTQEQRQRWLPDMLGGGQIGAYALSEPESGSDAAALATSARPVSGGWELSGTKAWITHAGRADYYNVMARTGASGPRGISCFLVPGDAAGVAVAPPEDKMGLSGSPTAQIHLHEVHVEADRLIGTPGQGFEIAMAALDGGRLGIAACAVGLAQAALETALDYAGQRKQFGSAIVDFQGIQFLLADLATQIAAARALVLDAARLRDRGQPFGLQAAQAKLFATDMAMRVTTDAVQILGGAGYTRDFPVERYMREAKVLQIVEGTNQIQRLVIGRALAREAHR